MQDVLDLSNAIHARGMYLMVDIVSQLFKDSMTACCWGVVVSRSGEGISGATHTRLSGADSRGSAEARYRWPTISARITAHHSQPASTMDRSTARTISTQRRFRQTGMTRRRWSSVRLFSFQDLGLCKCTLSWLSLRRSSGAMAAECPGAIPVHVMSQATDVFTDVLTLILQAG